MVDFFPGFAAAAATDVPAALPADFTGALPAGILLALAVFAGAAWVFAGAALVFAGAALDCVIFAGAVFAGADFAEADFAVEALAATTLAFAVLLAVAGFGVVVVDFASGLAAALVPVFAVALDVDPRLFPADAAMAGLWLL